MRFQHSWQDCPLEEIPAESQARLSSTVRRALELGINHIETARGYGTSERQLGLVLPGYERDSLIVQTKLVPTADADTFRAWFSESLARLRLDRVDLLSLHGINDHRLLWYATRPGGCLEVARELQQQGLVGHVGFSTHGETELILDALRWEGCGGFDYVNLHYYYIFQQHRAALAEAAARDMGVFIISPADKGGMLYKPPARLMELCAPLHPLVFNCLWCLANEEIHTLSLGAAQPEDFDLQMTSLAVESSSDLVSQIAARLRGCMSEAVGEQLADDHTAGILRSVDQPGHMAVATILWLRNLAIGWGLEEYAKMRYQLLGNASTWFFGANASQAEVLAEALRTKNADCPFVGELVGYLSDAHARLWEAPKKRLSES